MITDRHIEQIGTFIDELTEEAEVKPEQTIRMAVCLGDDEVGLGVTYTKLGFTLEVYGDTPFASEVYRSLCDPETDGGSYLRNSRLNKADHIEDRIPALFFTNEKQLA